MNPLYSLLLPFALGGALGIYICWADRPRKQ